MIDPQEYEKRLIRDKRRGDAAFPFVALCFVLYVLAEASEAPGRFWLYLPILPIGAFVAYLTFRRSG